MQKHSTRRRVGIYDIDTGNNVRFKVVLLENDEGMREFEIILSSNGSEDYEEVYSHPFYQNFVIPWVHKIKNIPSNNVVNMAQYRANRH